MEKEKKKKMSVLILLAAILVVYDLLMMGFYFYWSGKQIAGEHSTGNIRIEEKVVMLDSLTLKQKLAQMIIVSGRRNGPEITQMNIGGIYLFGNQEKEWYLTKVEAFKNASRVGLFSSTDLEGYWNPFKRFYNSSTLIEIRDADGARSLGEEHGKILRDLGFTMNFAPVAEANGKIWDGRGFNGSVFEIAAWSKAYIEGLQGEGILSVVKHYPGGSIDTADPHKTVVRRNISGGDVFPFITAFRNKAGGVMVGHVVASGEIDSQGKPCTVSQECIGLIRKDGFGGLIVSDEVNMEGLSEFYSSKEKMYQDLINAGNDVILDFSLMPRSLDKLLQRLEEKVKKGEIDEKKVDDAVRRILKVKGYTLV